MRKYLVLVLALALLIVGCKEKAPEEPQSLSETAVTAAPDNAPEKAAVQDEPSDKESATKTAPEFPEKEFKGAPIQEEALSVTVRWNDKNTPIAVCDVPGPKATCKQIELGLAPGQKLQFDDTYLRVVPRVLIAKEGVDFEAGGAALDAGDKLALYRYQGEGTCAIATAKGFFEYDRCPDDENFNNMPTGEGGTAEVMQPQTVDWWIKLKVGWVRVVEPPMKIVTKSSP